MCIGLFLAGVGQADAAASVASQVDYYTTTNNAVPFTRLLTPMSTASGGSTVSQTANPDGSVTLTANASLGYSDSGFYMNAGTLGDLKSILVTGPAGLNPFGVNIWFDKDNNGEYFVWNNNVLTGLGGDSYILGPASQNGVLSINANSTFTSLNPSGGNYTLAQLENGAAPGINSNTKIAIWVGANVTNGGFNTTVSEVTIVHNTPPSSAPPSWNYNAWVDHGVGYAAPAAGDAYYPSVIYDANGFGAGTPRYSMWYSDGLGSVFLTTSSDGTTWGAPVTLAGIAHAHHVQVLYNSNCFGAVPCTISTAKYRMWFWDMGAPTLYDISSMATAESADGINWINKAALTQNPSAPLIQATGWNRGTYGPVSLTYQSTAANTGTEPWNYRYVMYYNGTDGGHEDTGLAYSADGLFWNAYTVNPVLSGSRVGGSEAWDCMSATYGTVFKDSLGYHYFYSGSGQDNGSGGCAAAASFNGVGYAYSTDGKIWLKDPDPFFKISDGVAYRSGRLYTPSVVHDGSGILRMYFSAKDAAGGPKKIGYATLIEPAILHVIKLVVHGNGGAEISSDFSVHLKSAGTDVSGSPLAGVIAPGTGYALSAGTYVISEAANAAYSQSFAGDCNSNGSVLLAAGDDKVCTIIDTDIPAPGTVLLPDAGSAGGGGNYFAPLPLIDVTKIPSPLALPSGGGPVTYTYTVTNIGVIPMGGVWVKDNQCSPVNFISGDDNSDGKLDTNETWIYRCKKNITQTETNTATAHGSANGWDAYDAALATVAVGLPLTPPVIHIVKTPSRVTPFPPEGGDVTYSYAVTNPGVVPMHDVVVTDDKCGPLFGPFGDAHGDNVLDPGETWAYTCKINVAASTRNIATVEGRGNGFIALDYAFNDVFVSAGVVPNLPNTGLPNAALFGQHVKAIAVNVGTGSRGNNVTILQQFLISQNKGPAAQSLANVGATAYFGVLTRAALAEYQAKVGISPALGNFGPITRVYVRAHY